MYPAVGALYVAVRKDPNLIGIVPSLSAYLSLISGQAEVPPIFASLPFWGAEPRGRAYAFGHVSLAPSGDDVTLVSAALMPGVVFARVFGFVGGKGHFGDAVRGFGFAGAAFDRGLLGGREANGGIGLGTSGMLHGLVAGRGVCATAASFGQLGNPFMKGGPEPQPGILEIRPYVGGEGTESGHALASNENPLGAGEAARVAFLDTAKQLHVYPDGGAGLLRKAIAEVHGLDPARIVCGTGSDELIALLCRAYAGPGSEVIHSAHGFLM